MSGKVGPWIDVENGLGACRLKQGGKVGRIADRVAFVEKTPRIRIRDAEFAPPGQDHLNWADRGYKGTGPQDPESRKWCDDALRLFGYDLIEDQTWD